MTDKPDLDELARLLEKATPGPWYWDGFSVSDYDGESPFPMNMEWCSNLDGADDESDGQLMVALRNAAPSLIAEVEALRGEVARLREWQPLTQDDAETKLWHCLRDMLHPTDDKCLIFEMRKRGLWVYARAERKDDE